MSGGIYVASKVHRAGMWIKLRASGVPIISTWIDEAGQGRTKSWSDLWIRCVEEASHCNALILYIDPWEVPKGALVEVGAALAGGATVFRVGEAPMGSFIHHPRVVRCTSIEEAVKAAMEAVNAAQIGPSA